MWNVLLFGLLCFLAGGVIGAAAMYNDLVGFIKKPDKEE